MAPIARVEDERRDVRGVGHRSAAILVARRGALRIASAAPVAQRIERGRPKACVGSSNLSGGAFSLILDGCPCPSAASSVLWSLTGWLRSPAAIRLLSADREKLDGLVDALQ